MNNIFKNAYFGKAYKTRKGEKLIFQQLLEYLNCAQLFSETRYLTYDLDGFVSTFRHTVPEDEIIGEWQEEINEEELNMLAEEYASTQKSFEEAVIAEKAYEAGYREGYKTRGL